MPREHFRMECDCAMYEENVFLTDSGIEMLYRHGFRVDDFIIFKYCPWCGKKLVKITTPDDMSLYEQQRCSYKLHTHMPIPQEIWKYFFRQGVKEWKSKSLKK